MPPIVPKFGESNADRASRLLGYIKLTLTLPPSVQLKSPSDPAPVYKARAHATSAVVQQPAESPTRSNTSQVRTDELQDQTHVSKRASKLRKHHHVDTGSRRVVDNAKQTEGTKRVVYAVDSGDDQGAGRSGGG